MESPPLASMLERGLCLGEPDGSERAPRRRNPGWLGEPNGTLLSPCMLPAVAEEAPSG